MKFLLPLLIFLFVFFAPVSVSSQVAKDSTVAKFTVEKISNDERLSDAANKYIKKGDAFFELGPIKYEKALEEYQKALKLHPNSALVNFKLGYTYLQISKYKSKSIHYLEKSMVISRGQIDKKIRFYLAKAYQINHDPKRAINEYKKYIKNVRDEAKRRNKDTPLEVMMLSPEERKEIDEAYNNVVECVNFLKANRKPIIVRLTNMGDSINSPYPDYDPFVTANDSMLIFTSRRETKKGGKAQIDGEYYEDVYISYKVNGNWSAAKKFKGKMNYGTNDAVVGLSHDGLKMFIYRDKNKGDIYLSEFKKGSWSTPKNVKAINTIFHESSACFSPDNKTIYFVSDRPDGEGGRDIYKITQDEKGKWGEPVNIGPPVNSPFDEERVYMHPDGKTLFFSSKGEGSIGGYDIFKSVWENGKWSVPENLGYPINDIGDDFSFVMLDADMKRGYYSSYKENGMGDKDIYFVKYPSKEDSSMVKLESLKDSIVNALLHEQLLNMDSIAVDPLDILMAAYDADTNLIELKNLQLQAGMLVPTDSLGVVQQSPLDSALARIRANTNSSDTAELARLNSLVSAQLGDTLNRSKTEPNSLLGTQVQANQVNDNRLNNFPSNNSGVNGNASENAIGTNQSNNNSGIAGNNQSSVNTLPNQQGNITGQQNANSISGALGDQAGQQAGANQPSNLPSNNSGVNGSTSGNMVGANQTTNSNSGSNQSMNSLPNQQGNVSGQQNANSVAGNNNSVTGVNTGTQTAGSNEQSRQNLANQLNNGVPANGSLNNNNSTAGVAGNSNQPGANNLTNSGVNGANNSITGNSQTVDLKTAVVGEWKNSDLHVKVNSYQNTLGNKNIDANEQSWASALNSKPYTTQFNNDGTYKIIGQNLKGEKIREEAGTWYVKNDTLIMKQKQISGAMSTIIGVVGPDGNLMLRGKTDWDNDGKIDDEYSSKLKSTTQNLLATQNNNLKQPQGANQGTSSAISDSGLQNGQNTQNALHQNNTLNNAGLNKSMSTLDLQNKILGTWNHSDLNAKTNVNTPNEKVIQANEKNWSEVLKNQAPTTTFTPDGKYTTTYKDVGGKKLREERGAWSVINDTLLMKQSNGAVSKLVGVVDANGNLNLSGLTDFDNDGKADDAYAVVLKSPSGNLFANQISNTNKQNTKGINSNSITAGQNTNQQNGAANEISPNTNGNSGIQAGNVNSQLSSSNSNSTSAVTNNTQTANANLQNNSAKETIAFGTPVVANGNQNITENSQLNNNIGGNSNANDKTGSAGAQNNTGNTNTNLSNGVQASGTNTQYINNTSVNNTTNGAPTMMSTQEIDLKNKLIGEWKDTLLTVNVKTSKNTAESSTILVSEPNWLKTMKTKPSITVFNADGTFKITYKNAKDSIVRKSKGTWFVVNDTLVLKTSQPNATIQHYKAIIGDDGKLQLSGIVDWDKDGKKDDEYVGVLKQKSGALANQIAGSGSQQKNNANGNLANTDATGMPNNSNLNSQTQNKVSQSNNTSTISSGVNANQNNQKVNGTNNAGVAGSNNANSTATGSQSKLSNAQQNNNSVNTGTVITAGANSKAGEFDPLKESDAFKINANSTGNIGATAGSDNSYLRNQLIGDWQDTLLTVIIKTANNTTVNKTINANEGNWLQVLNAKPYTTTFNSDGTYLTVYKNSKDEITKQISGNWLLQDDTLVIKSTDANSSEKRYKASVAANGKLTLHGIIDWDKDGKKDDKCTEILKRTVSSGSANSITQNTGAINNSSSTKDLTNKLIGEWNEPQLLVELNSGNNGGKINTLTPMEQGWLKRFDNIDQSIVFSADGAFITCEKDANGVIQKKTAGTWKVEGDKLILENNTSNATAMQFYISSAADNKLRISGMTAWDSDGKNDDEYYVDLKRNPSSVAGTKTGAIVSDQQYSNKSIAGANGTEITNGNDVDNSNGENITSSEKSSLNKNESSLGANANTNLLTDSIESAFFANILFDYDRSAINKAGATELKKLVSYLKKYPSQNVKIIGHTDSKGKDDYNLKLSKRRAQSVSNYILNKGISKNRIAVEFMGESRPAAPNENPDKSDNPAGRKLNRRAELVIILNLTK